VTPVRIPVAVPGATHDVLVGTSLLGDVAGLLPIPPHATTAVVLTNVVVAGLHGDPLRTALADAGLRLVVVGVPDGEQAKTLATVESVYHRLAAAGVGRSDVVVTLGGGVITDLGGFVAATWHRGLAVLHCATTLLAQVDAAIGGKTGVNLPAGKNLVGAFHQPAGVLCDTATLATLPTREVRNGLGEVAKYGFIADPEVLSLLERDPSAAVAGDPGLLTEVVTRGVRTKARVVAGDEREGGERALLNYGHTLGHAIEVVTGFGRYGHGEAVALGMVFAARLAERLGVADTGLAERTVALLRPLGLPTGDLDADPDELIAAMRGDKKARGGVRFVLCSRPGEALLVDPPDERLVREVLATLR